MFILVDQSQSLGALFFNLDRNSIEYDNCIINWLTIELEYAIAQGPASVDDVCDEFIFVVIRI